MTFEKRITAALTNRDIKSDALAELERFPLRLNRDSQSGRKGGVSGRDSPSGGCPYGQAVFVGFA